MVVNRVDSPVKPSETRQSGQIKEDRLQADHGLDTRKTIGPTPLFFEEDKHARKLPSAAQWVRPPVTKEEATTTMHGAQAHDFLMLRV
jgi:hypothetical protein